MKKKATDAAYYLFAGMSYSVSVWASVTLFKEFGGPEPQNWIPFVVRAVAFEGTRALLWIKGLMEKRKIFIVTALGFTMIALVATTASVLGTVSASSVEAVTNQEQVADLEKEIEILDQQLKTMNDRYAAMPSSYVSQAAKLGDSIKATTEKRQKKSEELKEIRNQGIKTQKQAQSSVLFDNLARFCGLKDEDKELFRIIFLLIIALGTEISALMLSWAAITGKKEEKADEIQSENPVCMEETERTGADTSEPADTAKTGQLARAEEADSITRFCSLLFSDSQYPRSSAVPSWKRAKREGVSEKEYEDIIRRGILSGVMRRSKGKLYLRKGVERNEFEKEVRTWPE